MNILVEERGSEELISIYQTKAKSCTNFCLESRVQQKIMMSTEPKVIKSISLVDPCISNLNQFMSLVASLNADADANSLDKSPSQKRSLSEISSVSLNSWKTVKRVKDGIELSSPLSSSSSISSSSLSDKVNSSQILSDEDDDSDPDDDDDFLKLNASSNDDLMIEARECEKAVSFQYKLILEEIPLPTCSPQPAPLVKQNSNAINLNRLSNNKSQNLNRSSNNNNKYNNGNSFKNKENSQSNRQHAIPSLMSSKCTYKHNYSSQKSKFPR
jgi:hypothetical protein